MLSRSSAMRRTIRGLSTSLVGGRSAAPLTKLVATIGPASEEMEPLQKCVAAGMNVMRLNFSHATAEEFFLRTGNLSQIAGGDHVGIMLDTRGPEIRTGGLRVCKESGNRKAKVKLVKGTKIVLTTEAVADGDGTENLMFINYGELPKRVKVGSSILIDDGIVTLKVEKIDGDHRVECVVQNTSEVGERKGVNVPGVPLGLPAMSEKDKVDIKFGIANGIDIIAASFISNGKSVLELKDYISDCITHHPEMYASGETVLVISKIESTEALDNLDDIIDASDGIMVARGDLGVEVPIVSVATWQKTIVERTISYGKPVVVATQMLESMQKNPRPTRAEVADVANAVLEGADCVMLSGESANGDYPDLSISTQREICQNAETWEAAQEEETMEEMTVPEALGVAAVAAQQAARAKCIVVVDCEMGVVTRTIAKCRPSVPIFALVESKRVARQLSMWRAVTAYAVPKLPTPREAAASARAHGFAADGDDIVVLSANELSIL